MSESKDSSCPLLGDRICMMVETKPNWNECPLKAADDLESAQLRRDITSNMILVDEFRPKELATWGGITFESFRKHVMDPATPRP